MTPSIFNGDPSGFPLEISFLRRSARFSRRLNIYSRFREILMQISVALASPNASRRAVWELPRLFLIRAEVFPSLTCEPRVRPRANLYRIRARLLREPRGTHQTLNTSERNPSCSNFATSAANFHVNSSSKSREAPPHRRDGSRALTIHGGRGSEGLRWETRAVHEFCLCLRRRAT